MKADGFKLLTILIRQPKQVEKIDNELFAVVPMTMKFKSSNGNIIEESSIVGISDDNGINWKFFNTTNQERFKAIFPKAAEKIQISTEQSLKLDGIK